MVKPNLFIVGQPKSGTTGLYRLLEQHPEVFMPEEKEPHHFSRDLEREEFINFDKKVVKERVICAKYKNVKEYLKLFASANKKVMGEATTNYLYSKVAANEIKKFNSSAKIIILLREPVDFIISLFQANQHTIEKAKTLEEGFFLEKARKEGKYIKCGTPKSLLYYFERIKYAEQIKRYLENFSKKNILIILFEDFKKDNPKTFKQVCEFLNVDASFVPKFKMVNPSLLARSKSLRRFLDFGLLLKFRKFFRRITPPTILKKLDKIYFNILYKKKKISISEKLRKDLKKKFKKEVVLINKLLHENSLIEKKKDLVNFWGYDKI